MIVRSAAPPVDEPSIEQVIVERVTQRAHQWFPGLASTAPVRIELLSRRHSCSLFVVHVGTGPAASRVLAKVRLAGTAGPSSAGRPGVVRPNMGSRSLTPQAQSAVEYAGLQAIRDLFGTDHPAFGIIRPLEHLPAEATILMDYVDAGTLRQTLMAQSRLRLLRSALSSPDPAPWRRAGQWLRRFQDFQPSSPLPSRQTTRDEVVEKFHAYHGYLAGQLGARAVGDVATRGAALAAAVLPEQLRLTVGHSDYAPRNMFLLADGRLTVFDPLPRWMVPRYEDLCRFLIGMRLLGLQVHSHGAAIDGRLIEAYERDVISGYVAGDRIPLAEIRCYQLLILLDKWSALVGSSRSGRGVGRRARQASLRLALRYARGQGDRLLALASSSD